MLSFCKKLYFFTKIWPCLKIRQISTKEKKLRFGLVSQVCETNGFGACFFSNTRPDEKLQILVIFAATCKEIKYFEQRIPKPKIKAGINPAKVERVKGIGPSQPAWKAGALPLSYTRKSNARIILAQK